MLKNVTESLQRVIESKHQFCSTVAKELMSRSEDKIQQDVPEDVDISSEALKNPETNTQRTTPNFQLTQAAQSIAHRRERRLGLYEKVIELRKKGLGLKKKLHALSALPRILLLLGFAEAASQSVRRA